MPRPKWNPEPRTVRWVLDRIDRAARDARRSAKEHGQRGLFGAAVVADAQAQALEEFSSAMQPDLVPDAPDVG